MKFRILLLMLLLTSFVVASPQSLTINGVLQNATDNTTLTGTYVMNFSIYSVPTGGSALFNQNKSVTTDSNGLYNSILDSVDLDFSVQYYLGVQINSDAEMLPRLNITNTPYSFTTRGLDSSISLSHNVSIDSGTLFIDSSNNRIGIGTTSPTYKLEVAGNTSLNNTLYVTESGNVGIGTNSPAVDLHVLTDDSSNASITNVLRLDHTTSSVSNGTAGIGTGILLRVEDSVADTEDVARIAGLLTTATNGSEASALVFYTGSGTGTVSLSERMRINSDGDVGIGTTNPIALLSVGGTGEAASLSVTGQSGITTIATYRDVVGENVFKAEGNISGANLKVWFGDMDEAGNGNYLLVDEGNSKFIFNNGKVGIGTTSPAQKLVVVGDLNVTGTSYLGNVVINSENITTDNVISKNGNISFFNSTGNEKMRITSDGKVGIGTSSPEVDLHIGDGTGTPAIRIDKHGNNHAYIYFDNAGSEKAQFKFTSGDALLWRNAGKDLFTILEGGDVGIGTTTPTAKLEVSNSTQSITFSPTGGVGSSPLINTTSSTNVTITSDGGSVIIKLG